MTYQNGQMVMLSNIVNQSPPSLFFSFTKLEIAEENHDVEVKPSNQIKQQEIASRNGPCDIHVKASRCIDLALQASTPITFILTGITTSREIRIRKLFVNGQKYVFV
uniref:Uncharacterized protein n=1 Tax=Loa loa TaxID=7209 RepID=A0A1I7W2A9_LOALO